MSTSRRTWVVPSSNTVLTSNRHPAGSSIFTNTELVGAAEQAIGATGCVAPERRNQKPDMVLWERAALALWPGIVLAINRQCEYAAGSCQQGNYCEDAEDNQSHSAITTAGIDGRRTSDLLALSILRSAVY
jgi:hypothetical protein